MIEILTIISVLAVLFSMVTCYFSIYAMIKVVGLENSTHKVQYMPMEEYKAIEEHAEDDSIDPERPDLPSPKKREEKRVENLLEGFDNMYNDSE